MLIVEQSRILIPLMAHPVARLVKDTPRSFKRLEREMSMLVQSRMERPVILHS